MPHRRELDRAEGAPVVLNCRPRHVPLIIVGHCLGQCWLHAARLLASQWKPEDANR